MKERSADIAFRGLLKKNYIRLELEKVCDKEKGTIEFRLVDVTGIKIGDL